MICLPEDFSLPSTPSKALLVISNSASSGEVIALRADVDAGLSNESLSDRSDLESSSAERGLLFWTSDEGWGWPNVFFKWFWMRWLRKLFVSKSQGLTIPLIGWCSLYVTFVQGDEWCFGLYDRMSLIRNEVNGLLLSVGSGEFGGGELDDGDEGIILSFLIGLKYSSESESEFEFSFSSPGSIIDVGVSVPLLDVDSSSLLLDGLNWFSSIESFILISVLLILITCAYCNDTNQKHFKVSSSLLFCWWHNIIN